MIKAFFFLCSQFPSSKTENQLKTPKVHKYFQVKKHTSCKNCQQSSDEYKRCRTQLYYIRSHFQSLFGYVGSWEPVKISCESQLMKAESSLKKVFVNSSLNGPESIVKTLRPITVMIQLFIVLCFLRRRFFSIFGVFYLQNLIHQCHKL